MLQLLLGQGLLYLVRELVEGWIPVGQVDPSSTVGDSLLGKNAKRMIWIGLLSQQIALFLIIALINIIKIF